MDYGAVMEDIGRGFEIAGVAIIAVGALYAVAMVVVAWPGHAAVFGQVRRNFGLPLILGLEVLVAADIIETVTVDRTLESIAGLGILVLARIALSFSLDIEVDGFLPWRRAEFELREPST